MPVAKVPVATSLSTASPMPSRVGTARTGRRDTSRRPVRAVPTLEGIGLAVDKDVATGTFATGMRLRAVKRVGVRDADRQVELAVRIAAVDQIGALGRASIALLALVTGGRKAQIKVVIPVSYTHLTLPTI